MEKYYKGHLKQFGSLSIDIKELLSTYLENLIAKVKLNQLNQPKKVKKRISVIKSLDHPNNTNESAGELNKKSYIIDEDTKLQMLKRLQREKKERQNKIKADLENQSKKILEDLELEKIALIKLKEKQQEEKIQRLHAMHDQTQQRKQDRLENLEKSNKELQKVSSMKPLFKELEERYNIAVELPELEQRKKELAKRRQLLMPLNLKEISIHKKNYEKLLENMETKRKVKIAQIRHDELVNSSCQDLYKAKIFEVVKQSEREQAEAQAQKEIYRKQLVMKSRQYGEIVTELYKPMASKIAEKSMSQKKLQNEEVYIESRKDPIREQAANVGSNRTKSTKVSINRLARKLSMGNKSEIESAIKDKSFDYLAYKRKIRAKKPKIYNGNGDWQEIVEDKSLDPIDKVHKLESRLKRLENQTKSYEMLSGISSNIALTSNLNQSYVDSIKIKLAYLNELVNT